MILKWTKSLLKPRNQRSKRPLPELVTRPLILKSVSISTKENLSPWPTPAALEVTKSLKSHLKRRKEQRSPRAKRRESRPTERSKTKVRASAELLLSWRKTP